MLRSLMKIGTIILIAAFGVFAQNLDSMPEYKPQEKVSGTIRSWGNDTEEKLFGIWEKGFRKYHPDVKFSNNLISTAVAMPGLIAGTADLAVMGREISHFETVGFRRTYKYEPIEIKVTTGSHDVDAKTFPMVVFVHKSNPLAKLTLSQLDAIFGSELKGGAKKVIRTWGDLGLKGEWANKPINLYSYETDSAYAYYFSEAVMKGSVRWNCNFKGFENKTGTDGKVLQAGEQIIAALAGDKYGMAYSGIRFKTTDVKPLSLAAKDGGEYIEPIKANTINRTYPLIRDTSLFINRPPGKPLSPLIREFLSYVLSREGQRDILTEGDYLPLTTDVVLEQRRKID